jgi:hypothetical protein
MTKRANGADPWSELPSEIIEVDGVKVKIRGLSWDEATTISDQYQKNPKALAKAFICACCTRLDGVELTMESVGKFRPSVMSALDGAIGRLNGTSAGNSSATDDAGSSTA